MCGTWMKSLLWRESLPPHHQPPSDFWRHMSPSHRRRDECSCLVSTTAPLTRESCLLQQDPRGYPRTPFDNNAWEIQPEEGDMIIFPSWLSHEVLPTLGAAPRISIAFNMNFKPNLETDPGCLMPWVVTTGVSEQRNVSELQPPTPFSPDQGDESGPE